MTYYFLESSAFAKLFLQERGSAALVRLIEAVADEHKFVSPLAPIEVRSAIRRQQRAGAIGAGDANAMLDELDAEMLRIVEQPIGPPVLQAARRVLDAHPLRSLDALHLATCIMVRELLRISDIQFVSSDEALLAAAAAENFEIFDPTSM